MYIIARNRDGRIVSGAYHQRERHARKAVQIMAKIFKDCKVTIEPSKKTELVLQ